MEEVKVDPATLKLRNEARVAIDACEELAGKEGLTDQERKTPWSAPMREAVVRSAMMGGLDDFLQHFVNLEEISRRARGGGYSVTLYLYWWSDAGPSRRCRPSRR